MATRRLAYTCVVLLVLLGGAGLSWADPMGTTFTYQGQLKDGGVPCNGFYDMTFGLYDSPDGLTSLASRSVRSVPVANGLFTVNLDMGGVYSGGARWLEISVRPTGSLPAYTTLSPRQEVYPVPYAMCASSVVADSVNNLGLANDGDSLNKVSGGLMYSVPPIPFVGVGRNYQVAANECFGLLAPTDDSLGGMFVETSGSCALPFYGYAAGASGNFAYTWMDGSTGDWGLYNNGFHLTVGASGNVGIGTASPGKLLEVHSDSQAAVRVSSTDPSGGSVLELVNAHSTPDYLGAINFVNSLLGVPGQIGYHNDGHMNLRTAGADRMTILGNGNVGIGTTYPGKQLEVHSETQATVRVSSANSDGGSVLELINFDSSPDYLGAINFAKSVVGAAAPGQIGYHADDHMSFRTGGADRMVILGNGNVGIGTYSPMGPLYVRGNYNGEPYSGVITGVNTTTDASTEYDHSGVLGTCLYSSNGVGVTGLGGFKGVEGYVYTGGYGVWGNAYGPAGSTSVGTVGYALGLGTNYGVYGAASGGTTNYAGYFQGNVAVTGTLSKAGGSFKIDDPIDPEHKYLYHSFVESPDMKNIYDGVVTTDAKGYATVTLPDWFDALNKDFRYQLTVVDDADSDAFVQAKVVKEVQDNSFTIRTSQPDVKVSWQVTGIRQDAWANANRIPVEEVKPEAEQGKYLHPEAFGKPAAAGIAPAPQAIKGK